MIIVYMIYSSTPVLRIQESLLHLREAQIIARDQRLLFGNPFPDVGRGFYHPVVHCKGFFVLLPVRDLMSTNLLLPVVNIKTCPKGGSLYLESSVHQKPGGQNYKSQI